MYFWGGKMWVCREIVVAEIVPGSTDCGFWCFRSHFPQLHYSSSSSSSSSNWLGRVYWIGALGSAVASSWSHVWVIRRAFRWTQLLMYDHRLTRCLNTSSSLPRLFFFFFCASPYCRTLIHLSLSLPAAPTRPPLTPNFYLYCICWLWTAAS